MKVQEILENYNSLKASISINEAEVIELKYDALECKSANIDGLPKGNSTSSNIENYLIEKEEEIKKKEKYIKMTQLKLKIVEDLVKTLKKYNQDIIDMRYYQMMSIEEIAVNKNREYDAIQKTIFRSINIMQKEYNKNKMSVFCP